MLFPPFHRDDILIKAIDLDRNGGEDSLVVGGDALEDFVPTRNSSSLLMSSVALMDQWRRVLESRPGPWMAASLSLRTSRPGRMESSLALYDRRWRSHLDFMEGHRMRARTDSAFVCLFRRRAKTPAWT